MIYKRLFLKFRGLNYEMHQYYERNNYDRISRYTILKNVIDEFFNQAFDGDREEFIKFINGLGGQEYLHWINCNGFPYNLHSCNGYPYNEIYSFFDNLKDFEYAAQWSMGVDSNTPININKMGKTILYKDFIGKKFIIGCKFTYENNNEKNLTSCDVDLYYKNDLMRFVEERAIDSSTMRIKDLFIETIMSSEYDYDLSGDMNIKSLEEILMKRHERISKDVALDNMEEE